MAVLPYFQAWISPSKLENQLTLHLFNYLSPSLSKEVKSIPIAAVAYCFGVFYD